MQTAMMLAVCIVSVQRLLQFPRILTRAFVRLFRFYELRRAYCCQIDSFGMNFIFVVQTESKLLCFTDASNATGFQRDKPDPFSNLTV